MEKKSKHSKEQKNKILFDLSEDFYANTKIISVTDTQNAKVVFPAEDKITEEVADESSEEEKVVDNSEKKVGVAPNKVIQPGMTCRNCGIEFTSIDQQHQHFKSDWHRFNLRLKMSQLKAVSFQEFTELRNSGDISSSDESSDDEDYKKDLEKEAIELKKEAEEEVEEAKQGHKSPKVTFTTPDGTQFVIWRYVLDYIAPGIKKLGPNETPDQSFYIQKLRTMKQNKTWAILMISGGYFAGSIFEGHKNLAHKTIRRYTTRRKQGGSQSSKDKQGKSIQSAGAMIRRANEKKLREEVHGLMTVEWKAMLQACNLIFMFAPGSNKTYFINLDGALPGLLDKQDPRIHSVPFTTRRPTLVEIKRIHSILSTVEFGKVEEQPTEQVQSIEVAEKKPVQTQPDPDFVVESKKPATNPADLVNHFIEAAKLGDVANLQELYASDYQAPVYEAKELITPLYVAAQAGHMPVVQYLCETARVNLNIQIPKNKLYTAMHVASMNGHNDIVEYLLHHGADPSLKGIDSKSPYDISKDKNTRAVFRKFAGANPEMWNWHSLGVPPLTDDEERELEQKRAEKKKQKKKQQLQRAKQKKQEDEEKKKKEEEELRIKREKEAAEKEAAAIERARQEKMKNMTEREKRALAAENRLKGAENCANCGKALTGLVPFERLIYKYCTTQCVLQHRRKMETK
jgi:hypothetical protein